MLQQLNENMGNPDHTFEQLHKEAALWEIINANL